jgi:CDP-diacylglycerol--serine O-phosphatidyltransferase
LITGAGDWIYALNAGWFFLLALIMIFSFFLISEIPMFSMKFKNLSWKSNKTRYIFLLVSIPMLVLGYLAPLAIISWYLILSIVLSFRAQKA